MLRYVYFGKTKDSTKHNGIICVGYEQVPGKQKELGEYSYRYAMSFCRPGEAFSRKIAHSIIDGRMEVGQFQEVVFNSPNRPTYEQIVVAILNNITLPKNPGLLTWAQPLLECLRKTENEDKILEELILEAREFAQYVRS